MKRLSITIIAICVLVGFAIGFSLAHLQHVTVKEETRIFIPAQSTYQDVIDTLDAHHCLKGHTIFNDFAKVLDYPDHIHAGSYLVEPQTTVLSLVRKLNNGNQDALRVTLNKQRTLKDLCDFFGSKLDINADSLMAYLQSDSVCARYGHTPYSIIGLFPPNTYEFYWTTTPQALLNRMNKESEHFWNNRSLKLDAIGLTRNEVLTIASIVEEETNCNDEKADIASVYLNRHRIGMALQADPTVKFAIGDFTIRRIKGDMLTFDSPYNTYLHSELPPGPICTPSASSIDAVLQNKKTDYLFFCAKEDFSGRHNFAATSQEHANNALKFHKALNDRNIH